MSHTFSSSARLTPYVKKIKNSLKSQILQKSLIFMNLFLYKTLWCFVILVKLNSETDFEEL